MLAPLLLQVTSAQAQDAAAGEKIFSQCKICHQVGEKARHGIGPQLNGVVGRTAGKADGYNYSDATKGSGIVWNDAALREYLKDPAAVIAGTRMVFAGIQDDQSLGDLIAFLKTYDGSGKRP